MLRIPGFTATTDPNAVALLLRFGAIPAPHSIYRDCSNQDLMAAALSGLVSKYDLKGQTLGEVATLYFVRQRRRSGTPRRPLSRIKRATRLRLQGSPK